MQNNIQTTEQKIAKVAGNIVALAIEAALSLPGLTIILTLVLYGAIVHRLG